MKTIYSLTVMKDNEIQNELQLKGRMLEIEGTYFFPVLFSVWNIGYKSFFRKDRKSRSITGADLIRGGTGLADHLPAFIENEVKEEAIIEPSLSLDEQRAESREFIRNYYIHYKRIWTPPVIELVKEEIIHMPYTILIDSNGRSERKKFFLLEHSSKNMDYLSKYPHIEERCLGALKGGDSL